MNAVELEKKLIDAAQLGDQDVIIELLKAGVNVNARDEYGNTALIASAVSDKSNVGIIHILLDAGADFNIRNNAGNTALIEAACSHTKLEEVQLLLKAGADPNVLSFEGTALMHACNNNYNGSHLPVIESLLKHGADVNIQDHLGDIADIFGSQQIGDIALEYGLDLNVRNIRGETVLMKAVEYSNESIVRKFIKHGAEVNARSKNGSTALMVAAEHCNELVVRTLIECGADLTLRNKKGETALMIIEQEMAKRDAYSDIMDDLKKADITMERCDV